MGYFLLAALISIISTPTLADDLGISISIGQPGFYGQINLGTNYPRPRLIYPNPVLVMPPPVAVQQQPIYLYVPPGHAKKWDKYCYRYNACNQSVYFIQRDWYNDVYVPHYHSQHNYPNGQHYDSSRLSPENYQDRRNDHDNHSRGNDKHRGKQDQGKHDRKEHDRSHRKD